MQTETLLKLVTETLDDRKGHNIAVLDVREKTSFTDYMIVVSGTSGRHIKSMCDYVEMKAKENGFYPLGMEGDANSNWVLLDLGDVIVHAMLSEARGYYQLEKLWSVTAEKSEPATVQNTNA